MKISIITATYNSGKTVGDTLKSVLAQTYHDYELLVVDGASKDNTLEVVKKMEPLFEAGACQPGRGERKAVLLPLPVP